MSARRILVLGGTREAAILAGRLAGRGDLEIVTSLAGRTSSPAPVGGAVRIGGFGGADGLARYIVEERIDLLVDATHPFAPAISDNAAAAAARTATPRMVLVRPEWSPEPGDRWEAVGNVEAARQALPTGARVLLALGRQHIAPFGKRPDCFFLVRMIDAPAEPLPLGPHELVVGRPGITSEAEAGLLRRYAITHVVCRNSGGSGARAKLVAARELGLAVLMIRRPPPPEGRIFSDLDDLVAAIDQA